MKDRAAVELEDQRPSTPGTDPNGGGHDRDHTAYLRLAWRANGWLAIYASYSGSALTYRDIALDTVFSHVIGAGASASY